LYYDDMSEVDHLEDEQVVVMRPILEPKKSAVTKLNSPSFLSLRNGEMPYTSDPFEPFSPSKFSSVQPVQIKKEWEQ
jgi:hypothetical protein